MTIVITFIISFNLGVLFMCFMSANKEREEMTFGDKEFIEQKIISFKAGKVAGKHEAIDECIKLFDVCSCEECNACSDKKQNKEQCAKGAYIVYAKIIDKLKQLKESF